MSNSATLPSPQAKKERVNPRDIIGGTFEDIVETFTGTGSGYLNEGGQNQASDYSSEPKEPTNVTPFPSRGELSGFQTLSPDMKRRQISAELIAAENQAATQAPIEMKRTKINQLNGLQESYKGSVNAQGNVTEYHQANAERVESQNEAIRIQEERDRKRFESKKGGKGFSMNEGELEKGGENFDHFTKAVA